ncbi:MAG: DoxX family protein [Verrucomicrobiales bacterium]
MDEISGDIMHANQSLTRRALFGGLRGNAITVDVGLLILRVVAGLALCTVFEKVLPREGRWGPQEWFISDVAKMGFPLPIVFAWAAVLSEFVGGIMMMLGVLTRPAAFMNAGTTFVAAFLYHHGDISKSGLMAFIFFAITLSLTIAGPGRFSADALLSRRFGAKEA